MQIVGGLIFYLKFKFIATLKNKMDDWEKHHLFEIWYSYIQGSVNMFWYCIAKSSWLALWVMIGCY